MDTSKSTAAGRHVLLRYSLKDPLLDRPAFPHVFIVSSLCSAVQCTTAASRYCTYNRSCTCCRTSSVFHVIWRCATSIYDRSSSRDVCKPACIHPLILTEDIVRSGNRAKTRDKTRGVTARDATRISRVSAGWEELLRVVGRRHRCQGGPSRSTPSS